MDEDAQMHGNRCGLFPSCRPAFRNLLETFHPDLAADAMS
jgi:hypothetical protein